MKIGPTASRIASIALPAIVCLAACAGVPGTGTEGASSSWYERGLRLVAESRYDEAIDCFDRAIASGPENEEALVARGSALRTVGRYEDAYRDLVRAVELDPTDPLAYYARGLVFEEVNNYESAAADYTTALGLDPDNVDCLFRRGLAYRELTNTPEAIADFDRACEHGYGPGCDALTELLKENGER
jgi:tetratricopeptide (TPR) repeat protein